LEVVDNMKKKTKIIIGSSIGGAVLLGTLLLSKRRNTLLDEYNLNHNNSQLIPKIKKRVKM
jgi:nitrate reductase gamma subunit